MAPDLVCTQGWFTIRVLLSTRILNQRWVQTSLLHVRPRDRPVWEEYNLSSASTGYHEPQLSLLPQNRTEVDAFHEKTEQRRPPPSIPYSDR